MRGRRSAKSGKNPTKKKGSENSGDNLSPRAIDNRSLCSNAIRNVTRVAIKALNSYHKSARVELIVSGRFYSEALAKMANGLTTH